MANNATNNPATPNTSKKTNESGQTQSQSKKQNESFETLIQSGRQLAVDYAGAKRTEVEQYANEMLTMAQESLVKAIDSTVENVTSSLERALDRSRDGIKKFASDVGGSVQTSFKKIDAKPALPMFAAFLGGCMLGIFLGMRSDSVRQAAKSIKDKKMLSGPSTSQSKKAA